MKTLKGLFIAILALGMSASFSETVHAHDSDHSHNDYSDSKSREIAEREAYKKYDAIYEFSEGLAVVKGKTWYGVSIYGYVNEDYKVVIEPQFRKAKAFSNGVAKVMKKGGYGIWIYIDRQGEFAGRVPNKWRWE